VGESGGKRKKSRVSIKPEKRGGSVFINAPLSHPASKAAQTRKRRGSKTCNCRESSERNIACKRRFREERHQRKEREKTGLRRESGAVAPREKKINTGFPSVGRLGGTNRKKLPERKRKLRRSQERNTGLPALWKQRGRSKQKETEGGEKASKGRRGPVRGHIWTDGFFGQKFDSLRRQRSVGEGEKRKKKIRFDLIKDQEGEEVRGPGGKKKISQSLQCSREGGEQSQQEGWSKEGHYGQQKEKELST